MGKTKHISYLKFWYLENKIKHWNGIIKNETIKRGIDEE